MLCVGQVMSYKFDFEFLEEVKKATGGGRVVDAVYMVCRKAFGG